MNIEQLADFLLASLLLNYVILLWWFAVFVFGHDWLYNLHIRWFNLSLEQFDALHYGLMGAYKLGVILLNLVPWLALQMLF